MNTNGMMEETHKRFYNNYHDKKDLNVCDISELYGSIYSAHLFNLSNSSIETEEKT